MIFFFKSDGTLIKSAPETVYQGSEEAGKVYVVAPLNANMLVDVYYELPNGERWGAYLLENNGAVINNEELPDGWALWSTTLESAITQYAGTLKAQFGFYQSGTADKVPLITSQGVTVTIAKGVVRDLPSAPAANVYEQIVNAISSIKQDIANLPNEYLSNTNEDKIALKNNSAIEYSENATAGTLPLRDKNGNVKTNEPKADNDAANKKFVNDKIVQNSGSSTDKVMSQKSVSDELNKKSNATNLENGEGVGSIKMSRGNNSAKEPFAFATGYYTSANAASSYAGGYYSKTTVEYSMSYGISTKTENGVLAAFGEYNNPTTGDIFEIGNGTAEERANAFAVLKDGRAKVKTAPKDNNDVVRLQELNAVQGNYSDITNIDLTTGDTTVEYDTDLGITVNAKGTITHENGATEQPTTKFELPIVAGDGISIDKQDGEEKIVIKAEESNSNLQDGAGENSLQQKEDPKYNGVIKAATKNPYAKVLYPDLTDEEPIGASGDWASAFGGNASAQAKRSFAGGTSSIAKGAYSKSTGDNTVSTPTATDSTAEGYQTTTDSPASHSEGSYTVVMSQKYVEGMFDPNAEPGQPGEPSEPGTTPTDTLEMDNRRGEAGHAEGFNSYVSGFAAKADGVSNVADGHISKSSGRSNRSWSYLSKTDGYQSVVKPDETDTTATGEGSWANGNDIQIVGAMYAYAGGQHGRVIATAHNSFSHGYNLVVEADSQAVFGKYNVADDISLFMIGAGTDEEHRKTSMRALKNGQVLFSDAPTNPEAPIRLKDFTDDYYPASKAEIAKLALKANDFTEEGTIKAALDNKVAKTTTTSQVYCVNSLGEQTTVPYTQNAVAFTLAMRNSNGSLKVARPNNDNEAVNREYLNAVAARLNNVNEIPIDSDLNNYTTPGTYFISGFSNIKNAPADVLTKGTLYVIYQQLYVQILVSADRMFIRQGLSSSMWLDWNKTAYTSDIPTVEPTIVDLGTKTSMTGADYTKLENDENALLVYNGVIYRRSKGTNFGYDEMQFESMDDDVQKAKVFITNCVVTSADEAAGVISVTDTSGLSVGLSIMFTTSGGSILAGISYRKITSIDTTNKKITVEGSVIDSDTLTTGCQIAVYANATSLKLTNCVVTSADESAGVISVTDLKSLTVGMYIDFRTSGGSRLAGISNRKITNKDITNNKITVSGSVIDSDTLTTGCYITLASSIGFNKVYNRVLKVRKNKPDASTAYVSYAYVPIGGVAVTPSKATASATSGTFTDVEWSTLQVNDNNYILFNNEIYRLVDKGHTTGIWSYSHTGWDGTAMQDKSINVTVSTGAWTLVVGQGDGVQFVELFPGGTLTTNQLATLKANKGNQIIYYGGVKYYFKLAYEKSSDEWLYESFYNGAITLTVNMTTGSATFDTAGGKLYLHSIYFDNATNTPLLTFYSTKPAHVTDKWIYDNLTSDNYYLTYYPMVGSITEYNRIGFPAKLFQTSSSPSWGANTNLDSASPTILSVSQATKYTVTEL